MSFPESTKTTVSYGNLTWDNVEGMYKYTETITYFCTEESVATYETFQNSVITAEQNRDSTIIINAAQGEKDWVTAGKATKA